MVLRVRSADAWFLVLPPNREWVGWQQEVLFIANEALVLVMQSNYSLLLCLFRLVV